jgi:hypothetical protein
MKRGRWRHRRQWLLHALLRPPLQPCPVAAAAAAAAAASLFHSLAPTSISTPRRY